MAGVNNSTSGDDNDYMEMDSLNYTHIVFLSIDILASLIPLWMFSAIITSERMRQQFRNQILLQYLASTFISIVVVEAMELYFYLGHTAFEWVINDCHFWSSLSHMWSILLFSCNWTIVLITVFYFCQNFGFQPRVLPHPTLQKVLTVCLLLSPTILGAMILSPSIAHFHKLMAYAHRFQTSCTFVTDESILLVKILAIMVPVHVAVVAIGFIVLVRYRDRRLSDSIVSSGTRLTSHLDSPTAYVVAVVILYLGHFLTMLDVDDLIGEHLDDSPKQWIAYSYTAFKLSQTTGVVGPLPWLLLPDIRDRVKGFRPFGKQGADDALDLTVRSDVKRT